MLYIEKCFVRKVKEKQEAYAKKTTGVVCCVSDHMIMFLHQDPLCLVGRSQVVDARNIVTSQA